MRTPAQLNVNNFFFLTAVEIFLVMNEKRGGWMRKCRKWRKISVSLLAAYAVITMRFPRAPQQSPLLSEIILLYP